MQRRDRQPQHQPGHQPTTPVRKRRVSRAEREARRQRQLYIGIAVAGALVVLVLAGGATYEYFVKPRQTLATVDGVNIRRRDYWKYRSHELIQQISQYQVLAQQFGQEQGQQYIAAAQANQAELEDLWGGTDVNETTLQTMVENQVYLQHADDLGITIGDQDVEAWINGQFAPSDAPLQTPTPSPTLIPTRAAWATETAVAGATQTAASQATGTAGAAAFATAEAAASPSVDGVASPVATPDASPVVDVASPATSAQPATPVEPPVLASEDASPALAEGSPAASPEGSPAASPIVDGTPESAATATTEPTPNPEQALSTAEAGFRQFRDVVFDEAHLSYSDYVRLIARPSIARERVQTILEAQVGQTAEQVHAAHILVTTADLATSIHDQVVQPGASFEDIARQNSTDTSTAPNGGDLGWFTRNMMVAPFSDVAFALQPGQTSQPFQTEFGWHIVLVYDRQTDRPMTDEQIQAEQKAVVDQWLQARLAESEIDSDHLDPTPSPAPGSQEFVPPPDAPPTPTASPTPLASPIASPEGSPGATPVVDAGTPPTGATPVQAVPTPTLQPTSTPPASPAA